MGGTAKKIIKNPGRALAAGATGGISEAFQQNPFGGPLPFRNPLNVGLNAALGMHEGSPGISGPFSLDSTNDQAAINALGEKQYQETLKQIPTEISNAMNKSLPGIAEDYNAGHLLNSSGYGNEVARQHSQMTKDLVGQAIQGRQGFQTGALQRGLSMEDFVNQANVAKSIGAQMAPQPASGKQNFGTVAQGLGALSPWASVGKAPKKAV